MDRPCIILALAAMAMASGCTNEAIPDLIDAGAVRPATGMAAATSESMSADLASGNPRHGAETATSELSARGGEGPTSRFPAQLFGTWDLGPRPCRLPVNADSDSPVRIESGVLQGYEHFETPKRVERISEAPAAWRIASTETYLGSQVTQEVRIFVLSGDSLVVTDGTQARHYRKCE